MNKLVTIRSDLSYSENTFYDLMDVFGVNSGRKVDKILHTQYGMQSIIAFDYLIVDDSKFAMFVLKYPEYIEKISYE